MKQYAGTPMKNVSWRFVGGGPGIAGPMSDQRGPHLDDTVGFVMQGYAWLPQLWRRAGGIAVHTRILGQRAVGLRGPQPPPAALCRSSPSTQTSTVNCWSPSAPRWNAQRHPAHGS
jgi:hypothetical protein